MGINKCVEGKYLQFDKQSKLAKQQSLFLPGTIDLRTPIIFAVICHHWAFQGSNFEIVMMGQFCVQDKNLDESLALFG